MGNAVDLTGDVFGERVSYYMRELVHKGYKTCGIKGRHVHSDSAKTRLWSSEIKDMADWRCSKCGSTEDLNSHHILSVTKFPEKKYDLDNGVCLCYTCHVDFHRIYGVLTHTEADLNEYLEEVNE